MKKIIKGKMIEIIDFYLIQCPVSYKVKERKKVVSLKGLTFEKMRYEKTEVLKLLHAMKKDINNNIYFVKNAEEAMRIEYQMKGSLNNNRAFEFIVCTINDSMSKTKNIFYQIRNCFAHGSFEFNEKKKEYTMISKKNDNFKAIIVLKESTLIKWISRFENKDFETNY